jgi:hypothetical protein
MFLSGVAKPDATHPKATPKCPTWIRFSGKSAIKDIGDARDPRGDWHYRRLAKVYEPGRLEHLRSLRGKSAFAPRLVSGQEMTCFLGPVMSYT